MKKINEDKFFLSYSQEITKYSILTRKFLPSIDDVINSVSNYFDVSLELILSNKNRSESLPRNFAIYLSQLITAQSQKIIAEKFGLTYSAVSKICTRLDVRKTRDVTKTNKSIEGYFVKFQDLTPFFPFSLLVF